MKRDDRVIKEISIETKMTARKAVILSDLGIKTAANNIQYLLSILLVAMGRKKFLRVMEETMEATLKDYDKRVRDHLEEEDE